MKQLEEYEEFWGEMGERKTDSLKIGLIDFFPIIGTPVYIARNVTNLHDLRFIVNLSILRTVQAIVGSGILAGTAYSAYKFLKGYF